MARFSLRDLFRLFAAIYVASTTTALATGTCEDIKLYMHCDNSATVKLIDMSTNKEKVIATNANWRNGILFDSTNLTISGTTKLQVECEDTGVIGGFIAEARLNGKFVPTNENNVGKRSSGEYGDGKFYQIVGNAKPPTGEIDNYDLDFTYWQLASKPWKSVVIDAGDGHFSESTSNKPSKYCSGGDGACWVWEKDNTNNKMTYELNLCGLYAECMDQDLTDECKSNFYTPSPTANPTTSPTSSPTFSPTLAPTTSCPGSQLFLSFDRSRSIDTKEKEAQVAAVEEFLNLVFEGNTNDDLLVTTLAFADSDSADSVETISTTDDQEQAIQDTVNELSRVDSEKKKITDFMPIFDKVVDTASGSPIVVLFSDGVVNLPNKQAKKQVASTCDYVDRTFKSAFRDAKVLCLRPGNINKKQKQRDVFKCMCDEIYITGNSDEDEAKRLAGNMRNSVCTTNESKQENPCPQYTGKKQCNKVKGILRTGEIFDFNDENLSPPSEKPKGKVCNWKSVKGQGRKCVINQKFAGFVA